MLHIMADNGETITSSMDGAMYNVFAGNEDFVIGDIGNELELLSSSSSFTVTMKSGHCLICGRHVVNDDNLDLLLSENDSGFIVLRYDLGQVEENICRLMAVNSTYEENINGSGTIHDIVLATYVTGEDGVTSMTDLRNIRSSAGGVFVVREDENGNILQNPIVFKMVAVVDNE